MKRTIPLACCILIGLAAVAAANPMSTVSFGSPPALPLVVLWIDYCVDLFFLLVGLALVRKLATISAGKLLLVGLAAAAAGLAADLVGALLTPWLADVIQGASDAPALQALHLSTTYQWLGRALIPAPFIFAADWLLARNALKLTRRESSVIGLVMAFCTTPIFESAVTQLNPLGRRPLGGLLEIGYLVSASGWVQPFTVVILAIALGLVCAVLLFRRSARSPHRAVWITGWLLALGVPAVYAAQIHNIDRRRQAYFDCAGNMRGIYVALARQAETDGVFPATLSDLRPEFLPDRATLHCRMDSRPARVISYDYHRPASMEALAVGGMILRCTHHAGVSAQLMLSDIGMTMPAPPQAWEDPAFTWPGDSRPRPTPRSGAQRQSAAAAASHSAQMR